MIFACLGIIGCGNGENGLSAYQIWLDAGYTGSETDFLEWIKGQNGTDGVGIADMYITEDGYLMVKYTNSTEYVNIGKIAPNVHEHIFGSWLIYLDNQTSCEDKVYYRQCNVCQEKEFKEGEYADHDFETNYSFNNTYHYVSCKNCKHI